MYKAMNITIKEENQQMVAVLDGDLNNMASTQAERDLAPLLQHNDCDIVLDCTKLNYISSSGLRILLNIFKHTRSNGHQCILRHLADDVKEVFQLAGFLQLFKLEQ